jgi:hypothetical protein
MNNDLMNWGEAYKALATLITTKVPAIKHVDLYYGQERAIDQDGNWIPFRAPAVFIDFNAAEVKDFSEGKQELLMDIGFFLCFETTADSNQGSLGQPRALAFIQLLRDLHAALHNAEGTHFGPLSRIALNRIEAPPYMIMYQQTYRTHMLDYSASANWDETTVPIPLELGTPADPAVPDPAPLFNIPG